MKGTICTIRHENRYAFVKGEDGTNYFLHISDIIRGHFNEAQVGVPVDFTPTDTDRGPRAVRAEFLDQ